jgi:hypothetical protein
LKQKKRRHKHTGTNPGRIKGEKGEKGKDNVIARTLVLFYKFAEERMEKEKIQVRICTSQDIRQMAKKHDPSLLQKGRLNWGIHFLASPFFGHLKRIKIGTYKILE